MIYLKKFDYSGLKRGEKKKAETENGRSMLKDAVLREYGAADLKIEKGEYGKPYFPECKDICFNISHSGDYVAVGTANVPIGVDVQEIREVREGLEKKLCNEDEIRFIEGSDDRNKAFMILWALKESYIKAIGKGMSFPMNEVNFRIENFSGELRGKLSNRNGEFFVKDYGNFVLAVCFLGEPDFGVFEERL